MSFGENLKSVRKQRSITQEELAELLGVSRQAISKWESDNGYPEVEKLLLLSKTLNISLDYLMNDSEEIKEKEDVEEKPVVYPPTGKISITNGQNVVVCHSVKTSKVLLSGKDEPKYVLYGIDRVSFWGEHSVMLGWYATLEDIQNEIKEITKAINNDKSTYELKYNAEIEEVGLFGSPKIKR